MNDLIINDFKIYFLKDLEGLGFRVTHEEESYIKIVNNHIGIAFELEMMNPNLYFFNKDDENSIKGLYWLMRERGYLISPTQISSHPVKTRDYIIDFLRFYSMVFSGDFNSILQGIEKLF